MILLYRDPKGETIGSITQVPSVVGKGISQVQSMNKSDWEKKVASLEKALHEKDAKIAMLMKNHDEKVSNGSLL